LLYLVRHLAAFGGTAATGFSAGFAVSMVGGMFFAFSGAGIAYIGAELHKPFRELRPPRIEPSAKGTDIGAVATELNAQRHIVVLAIGSPVSRQAVAQRSQLSAQLKHVSAWLCRLSEA
jgi:hypothetical protein